jgi:hypothetical protein
MWGKLQRVLVLAGLCGWIVGIATVDARAPLAETWGTIKGQVVYDGEPPPPADLKVDKDTDHCLAKGPIASEGWVVDPKTKGVRHAVVFLKAARGQTLPIHDSLKAPPAEAVVMDQPYCRFEPHVIALRAGQKLIAKNSAPIQHNVVLSGLSNSANISTPAGGSHTFALEYEPEPVGVSCGAHPWMKAYIWVFKHPYFAVTDAEGRFEIKLAPAGSRQLVVWHEQAGYVPNKTGQAIEVRPGETDVGIIEVKK